ncbi:zf-HC2 domain-containing protein [Actinoplanes sp. NPDC051851]|uniref:zf-HC2 domain-containing protein n=1 Tax=Actinoplanes sp. NPDC051851 TaxID=3154753 RepID=UPI00343308E7
MSDLDEHDSLHRLLGGYLLGGLDETDTERLDEHLHDCADCRAELDRLAPVPEMLQHMPNARSMGGPGMPPLAVAPTARPSQASIESLLGRMRAEKTRETRVSRVRWLAAAAVVLIAAAAVGFSIVTNTGAPQTPTVLPSAGLVTANFEPATGSALSGSAAITAKTWGVSIALNVSRMEGKAPFLCMVRSSDGTMEQAAAWGETPDGDAKVIGASSVKADDVDAIVITDADGKVLGTATVT